MMDWKPIRVAQLFAIEAALTLLLVVVLASVGVHADGGYVGRPIWMRNGYANAASFDGCFTDPTNPNPINARINTATVAAAANESTVVIAMGSSYVVSVGTCAAPATSTQISTVKDSNNFAFTRLGGSLITLTGGTAFSIEVWTSPVNGTGSASTGVTVTYPSARLAHTFEAFVYRQVASYSLAPIEKNESADTTTIWAKTFTSVRQVLAAVVTNDQTAGCSGAQPLCGYPSGTGPGTGGIHVSDPNEAGKLNVPPGPSSGASGGGYHLIASSMFPGWGAFQVNITETGARRFYFFLTSPTPTKETFVGAFVNGPEPAPPGPDAFSSSVVDSFIVFGFIAMLVLATLGAIELRKRFS